ncbi:MAG TPA: TetR/AcrR family transcriptional regulator [Polyangia bacterium]|jgi:AcrR family transcriptional regulator|nr:TetR/AcrR family transcriptional regulator [Polyangia bacterium]
MARPPTIKDAQILQAAREVFLEKGITATTAEVARRAGVAEGSLFNRFKTKHDLFRAAMRDQMEEPPWLETLDRRAGQGDVRETLLAVGQEIVQFYRRLMPLMMMSWSNPKAGLPELQHDAPLRAMRRVSAFFGAEMQAGRLRRHDPEILARSFLGGLSNYVFFEILLNAQKEMPMPLDTFLRGLVDLLWSGVAPATGGE